VRKILINAATKGRFQVSQNIASGKSGVPPSRNPDRVAAGPRGDLSGFAPAPHLCSTKTSADAFEMLAKGLFNVTLSPNTVIIENDSVAAYVERQFFRLSIRK